MERTIYTSVYVICKGVGLTRSAPTNIQAPDRNEKASANWNCPSGFRQIDINELAVRQQRFVV